MTFRYEKLPRENGRVSIRLLKLVSDDPPTLKIQAGFLDELPAYQALSYCWGTNLFTYKILIEGDGIDDFRPLSVAENLYNGLKRIYAYEKSERERIGSDRPEYIWIDAICINQMDTSEKEYQVPLMSQIYSGARRVIVWLGEPAYQQDAQRSRELVDVICVPRLVRRFGAPGGSQVDVLRMIESFRFHSKHKYRIDSFLRLMSNPWFTRVWIVQEVTVARNLVFLFGEQVCDGEKFFQCSVTFADLVGRIRSIGSGWKYLDQLNTLRCSWRGEPEVPLYELLRSTKSRNATLDRDYIYSIMSLANDIDKLELKPNYDPATSDADIYIDFACRLVVNGRNLNFLGESRVDNHGSARGRNTLDLPSWVPDWRVSPSALSLSKKSKQMKYNAGGDSELWFRVESPRNLRLRGTLLKIKELTIAWGSYERPYCMQTVVKHFNSMTSSLSQRYFTGESLLDVLCHLLAAGIPRADFGQFKLSLVKRRGVDIAVINVVNAWEKRQYFRTAYWLARYLWTSISAVTFGVRDISPDLYWNDRKIAASPCGTLSLVPERTSENDLIFFPVGCDFPLVVRATDSDKYTQIGAAYAHGYMYGDIWNARKDDRLEEICLV